jgi:hypothetical protein
MPSMLNTIVSGLYTALDAMSISGGYNYDVDNGYGVQYQQEDFAKAKFPLYNIYLSSENSVDTADFPNMNAFRNITSLEIHCYHKLSSVTSNSVFNIDIVLNNLLHDIKKLIGNYHTLNSTCEGIFYKRSERRPSGDMSDVLLPKKLVVFVDVYYSQAQTQPAVIASC